MRTPFLFVLLLLTSASAFAQWESSFYTRLTPYLAISGEQCKGGEMSGVSLRTCEAGQWLITLDDINQCSFDSCTEVYVFPRIAKLERLDVMTPSTIALYEIIPKDLISSSKRRLLNRYLVRFDLNGKPKVIRRDEKFYTELNEL